MFGDIRTKFMYWNRAFNVSWKGVSQFSHTKCKRYIVRFVAETFLYIVLGLISLPQIQPVIKFHKRVHIHDNDSQIIIKRKLLYCLEARPSRITCWVDIRLLGHIWAGFSMFIVVPIKRLGSIFANVLQSREAISHEIKYNYVNI